MKTDGALNNNIKRYDEYDNDLYSTKGYNRKVCRYAKKHKISGAKAFEVLYK